MKCDFWTPERVDILIRLWDAEWSAGQIREELCAESRNAVLGKINRLRVAGHVFKRPLLTKDAAMRSRISRSSGKARVVAVRARAPKQKPHNNLVAFNAARRAEIAAAKAMEKAAKKPVEPPSRVIDASRAKPWTERLFGECAFPILGEGADTVSCCIRTGGKTYCTGHAKLMYRAPEKTGADYVKSAVRLAA